MLSEYIVKNRGIIPTSAKDALLNYKQVQPYAFSRGIAMGVPKQISQPCRIKTPINVGLLE